MKKIFFLFLIVCASPVFAQNVEFTKDNFKDSRNELRDAKNQIEAGDKFYDKGASFYKQAIDPYLAANKFNPNNALLNFKIGKCYLSSNYKLKSIPFLEKALTLNPVVDPQIDLLLAQAYHLDMQWDKAIAEFKKYAMGLKGESLKAVIESVDKQIEECLSGKELVKKPVRVFIDNVGPEINSPYADNSPVITADESLMLFTSRRPPNTGGKTGSEVNESYEDIYMSTKVNGKWGQAQNIGKPINTDEHDANSGLSADGQNFLIYSEKNNGDLYESELKGTTWSKPDKMNKNINTEFHESCACYSPDGKAVYFVSDKPDGSFGGRDIYVSYKDEKGKWGKATNVGAVINTKYDEEGVFIHPDGKTMYFSSQGHKSMGGYDIFKSVFENGRWGEPENIGYPVNTPDDDLFFVMAANGKHGYYASFNTNGLGEKDIYQVTFLGDEKPMVLNNEDNLLGSLTAPVKETVIVPSLTLKEMRLTILKGVITDETTKQPLEATIEIVDNSNNIVIATFTSNSSTGKYLLSLPAGRNYGIVVKKDNYLFHSENFDIPVITTYGEITKDISLNSIVIGSKAILKNIFFDFDKATLRPESTNELERLVRLLKTDAPSLKIEISGYTDSKGADDYNKKLSESMAKAVVDYLISKDVSQKRVTSAGYGKEQPIATNDTEEGRRLNKRVEFKVLSK